MPPKDVVRALVIGIIVIGSLIAAMIYFGVQRHDTIAAHKKECKALVECVLSERAHKEILTTTPTCGHSFLQLHTALIQCIDGR